MTTPIANKNQTINVSVGIEILKFVALVSLNILRAYFSCLLMICIIFAGIFVLYRLQSADADICVLYCTVNNLLFFFLKVLVLSTQRTSRGSCFHILEQQLGKLVH